MSTLLARRNVWFVSEHYIHSDYHEILLQIENGSCDYMRSRRVGNQGWSAKKEVIEGHNSGGAVSEKVVQAMRRIMKVCYAAMPKRQELTNRQSHY